MSLNGTTHDVIVVGAGPVGMTSAILLAARGLTVLVVEKNAGTANDPKAISLDDESLRAYAQAGIAEKILGVVVPGTGTSYYDADGERLFHAGAPQPFRYGFPFKNPFAQPDLEKVLAAALAEHPKVTVAYSTELLDFEQDADRVSATISDAQGKRRVGAHFLLGADGGRSRVRAILDIGMTGRSHPEVWLVIDTLHDGHVERYGMHHGDPKRPHVIVPGLDGRCRYEFYTYPGECDPAEAPSLELIQDLLRPYRTITTQEVERAVAYRFHGLAADAWQSGRAFLLGDAAHMMPPFAGQGLNSGIRDAVNLTWKIAAVVQGESDAAVLESYEAERRPHAEAVIRSSERLGRVVMTTNPRIARFRDDVVKRALATAEGRAFFEQMRYRPSARIQTGLVSDPAASPLVGLPLAQPTVFSLGRRQQVPLDQLLGTGWSLIGVGLDAEAWTDARRSAAELNPSLIDVPLDDTQSRPGEGIAVAIDLDTTLVRELAPARGCFVLVRPDRVVALVAHPRGFAASIADLLSRIRPRVVVSALAS
ncbi:bifunctional 3-(3-hydroxy-phenyl)propionate/3-hydroxycinnamic acid hydroxylase [Herbiconiux liukaitaii]|uniref:bifunctional 3-(3-hydroxy-phenyl)propionate/3-hydroxycinnamic acid hydroxylase n=1 Tax=Herbiconiux liukaitaii TaxID=3342799 RepID=UPI0035B9B7BC